MNATSPTTVTVVANTSTGVFQSAVIRGAREWLSPRGGQLEVVELPTPPRTAAEVRLGGRGAIVLANALTDAVLAELLDSGATLTLVSHVAPGLGLPSVRHDNRHGMSRIAELLVERGAQAPVLVRGNPEQLDGREREHYLRLELLRRGLELTDDRILAGGFEPQVAASSIAALLDSGAPFDAVVGADYLMAVEVLALLRARGVAVPEAVSVVGFGDGPEAEAVGLTTVAADVVELGRRAARQLLAQLDNGRMRGHTLLSTRLVPRST